jgi:hypothetical protein
MVGREVQELLKKQKCMQFVLETSQETMQYFLQETDVLGKKSEKV